MEYDIPDFYSICERASQPNVCPKDMISMPNKIINTNSLGTNFDNFFYFNYCEITHLSLKNIRGKKKKERERERRRGWSFGQKEAKAESPQALRDVLAIILVALEIVWSPSLAKLTATNYYN
jgi:hypothetical protein